MDSLEEEQLRGITMKSSAISLYYTNGGFSVVMALNTLAFTPSKFSFCLIWTLENKVSLFKSINVLM